MPDKRKFTNSHWIATLRTGISCAALCTLALAQSAFAQDSAEAEDAVSQAAKESGQVYEPAYFEQFGPRTALDMVQRIPGFSISDGNRGQRGLGEANQNVLFNGERASSKSDSLRDQLRRIPAGNVERIEVVDGTKIDIPGLSGEVANVVFKATRTTGQFTWQGSYRPYNAKPGYLGGEASMTGTTGKLDYTISLSNRNNRFGADGPTVIRDGAGNIIEERTSQFIGNFDNPKLATNLTYNFSDKTIAHFNLSYTHQFFDINSPETAIRPGGFVRERDYRERNRGPEYEIGGDLTFPLGAGTIKLIALNSYERDNYVSALIDRYNDGSPATGNRYQQIGEPSERIARFEYSWKMWNGDWQISGESAFNKLKRQARLFDLAADEQFFEVPYPEGSGTVKEDRYEGIISYSRPLSDKVSLQITGGGEYSTIKQLGSAANSRTFQRPKGSLSLAWKPKDNFDISLEASRKVNQLSFGDFLASVSLNSDNANGGNNELVPYQSWNLDLQIKKGLGQWGSATFQAKQAWFQDFIDYFPLDDGGEARGNIGDARRLHLQTNLTLKGEPFGLKGAQLDIQGIKRWMYVDDPFTAETRGFSEDQSDELAIDFRHDIPKSEWAWGANLYTTTNVGYFRRYEVGRGYEGPVFLGVFVENKDVLGLTVNASANNLLGARNKFERTVYDGDRPDAPIRFTENSDRRIGPIFRVSVSGNF